MLFSLITAAKHFTRGDASHGTPLLPPAEPIGYCPPYSMRCPVRWVTTPPAGHWVGFRWLVLRGIAPLRPLSYPLRFAIGAPKSSP